MGKGRKRRNKEKRADPEKETISLQERNYFVKEKQQDVIGQSLQGKLQINESEKTTEKEQQPKPQLLDKSTVIDNKEKTFGQIVQRFSNKEKEKQKEKSDNDFFTEKKAIKKDSDGEMVFREKRRKRLKCRQKAMLRKASKNQEQLTEPQEFLSESDHHFYSQHLEDTKLFSVNEKEHPIGKADKDIEKQQNETVLKREETSVKKSVSKDKKEKQRKQQKMRQRKMLTEKAITSLEPSNAKRIDSNTINQTLQYDAGVPTFGQIVQRLERDGEEKEEKAVPLLVSVQDTRRKRMLRKQREAIQRTMAKDKGEKATYLPPETSGKEENPTVFCEQKQENIFYDNSLSKKPVLSSESGDSSTGFSEEKSFFEQEITGSTIENQRKDTYCPPEPKTEKTNDGSYGKNSIRRKRKQMDRHRNQKLHKEENKTEVSQKNKEKTSQTEESLETDTKTKGTKDTSSDFFPSKKLEKLEDRAEQAKKQTEKAQRKLKRKKKYKRTRIWEESSGRAKYIVTTVEVEKPPVSENLWVQGIRRIKSQGTAYFHGKIAEAEQENSAVEAAHKTEQMTETIYGYAISHRKTKYQRQKENLQKLQRKQAKAEQRVVYQRYLEEHPELSKKEVRKRMQKARIKKQYQKARRQAEMMREGKEAVVKAGDTASMLARKTQEFARKHAIAISSILAFGFLLVMLMMLVSSCSLLVGNVVSSSLMGCYLSDPKEMDAAELYLTKLEAELAETIRTIEEDYPGYQSYQYSLEPIGHPPFVLISFLSAVHTEFSFEEIKSEIDILFAQMYTLTITPTVTMTMIPVPVEDEDGNLQYEMIPQPVAYLTITLETKPLEELVLEKMDEDQTELYGIYQETKGGLQQFSSPMEAAWDTSVSSYYGYRQNKETGQMELHRGIDIEGSFADIYATHSGIVSGTGYDSDFGNWLSITDNQGFTTRYAHLDSILVVTGQELAEGAIIGMVGNSGNNGETGLHLEVSKDGNYYNPIFYFESGR